MLDRRSFLGGSLTALGSARVPHLVRPSDALRVAVVGLNGRGAEHAAALGALTDVRVTALCDVDDVVLFRESKKLRDAKPAPSTEFRKVLDRSDVDAVVLATPNHWHALQTIWACQAGKDVYLETPATHALGEGERLLAAAAKYERIVQCGYPARASPAVRAAIEWLRAGNLGRLQLVRGLGYAPRPSIGKVDGNQKLPDTVDYDVWCGPAPLQPLRRASLHRDWRWIFATGDGELGNEAAHVLDLARWVLGTDELPSSVVSLGGRVGLADDGQTPNTQLVYFAYQPVPLLFEVRGLPRNSSAQQGDWQAGMDHFLGVRTGVVVHAEGGTLRIPGPRSVMACDAAGKEIRRWEEGRDPLAAWVAACASRRAEDLASGIDVGVRSSALVHFANVSQRLARALPRKELLAQLSSSSTLTPACELLLAHLESNGVDLSDQPLSLGPRLVIDPATGRVQGNEGANELLAGKQREPYLLPAQV